MQGSYYAPQLPPKKKGGIGKILLITVAGIIGLIVIAGIASSAGGNTTNATATANTSAANIAPAGATGNGPTAVASTPKPNATAVPPTTAPTMMAATGQNGITFGPPVQLGSSSLEIIAVLATNNTNLVKTFTVKATYKTGNQITATATGAVNDLLPKSTRVVSLISTDKIPATYDSVRVDVDTLIVEAPSTSGAEVAKKQTFGQPTVKTLAGSPAVDIEVTNTDTKPHSYLVQVAFLNGGKIVGVSSGAVNDIASGQTKTVSLIGTGTTAGATSVPAIDTVIN